MMAGLQRDPAIVEALLDEAIDQAARGELAVAKQMLRNLVVEAPALPASKSCDVQCCDGQKG